MSFKKSILIGILIFWVVLPAIANEKMVIVATLDDYSPYCYPKDNPILKKKDIILPGADSVRLRGYSWDIFRESFHEMGYTIELKIYPWARAMKAVKHGQVDLLFPTGKNKERDIIFNYSKEPVNQANFLVYVNSDSAIQWKGLKSLHGFTIGVMRGWNYGENWKADHNIKKWPVNLILQGFKMLEKKRLDGFAGYEVTFDFALKKESMSNTFKKLPVFDSTSEYVVGLKTNDRILKLLNAFDKGKKCIFQNGKFEQIRKKWQ